MPPMPLATTSAIVSAWLHIRRRSRRSAKARRPARAERVRAPGMDAKNAEVIHWDELLEIGSWNKAKDLGKIRSEGKDYEVVDGDVLEFRFNV